jgi:hypothetical protein
MKWWLPIVALAGCVDRPLAIPAPIDQSPPSPDLAEPCLLRGSYTRAAQTKALDTSDGCAAYSLFEPDLQQSDVVLRNFAPTGSALLTTTLNVPGMTEARSYSVADLSSGTVDLTDPSGGSWVAGKTASGQTRGGFTLVISSVGPPQQDANGRPIHAVHGTFDGQLVSNPAGTTVVLHADF